MFPTNLLLLLLAGLVSAAELTLKSPKLTVEYADKRASLHEKLSVSKPLAKPVELQSNDVLSLNFQIVEEKSQDGVQPQQAFLRLYDSETEEEGIIPLRVTSLGKVMFQLNMAKPPSSLPPTGSNPLKASLILGSYTHTPVKWDLFDVKLPPSLPLPAQPEETLYKPLPTIAHTFRPDHKAPPQILSGLFSLTVLSPWIGLVVVLTQIPQRLPNLSNPSVLPFILLLALFEALFIKYWISLKLGQVLLYGFGIGIVTLLAGKRALTSLSNQRHGK